MSLYNFCSRFKKQELASLAAQKTVWTIMVKFMSSDVCIFMQAEMWVAVHLYKYLIINSYFAIIFYLLPLQLPFCSLIRTLRYLHTCCSFFRLQRSARLLSFNSIFIASNIFAYIYTHIYMNWCALSAHTFCLYFFLVFVNLKSAAATA